MSYKNNAPLSPQKEIELVRWQRETEFPKEMLKPDFKSIVEECFLYVSPYSLRMSLDDYKKILMIEDDSYSILDMNTICHVIRSRNAHDLGLDIDDYIQLQEAIEPISRKVLELISEKEVSLRGGKTVDLSSFTAQA